MNLKKGLSTLTFLGFLGLSLIALPVFPQALAHENVSSSIEIHRNHETQTFFSNPEIQMNGNNHFFFGQWFSERFFNSFPVFQRTSTPVRLIVIDREAPNNTIVLENSFTGPFSTNENTVQILVSDSVFQQLVNSVEVNQNIRININTGNNVVSFNTVVGNITTGDVNISLM